MYAVKHATPESLDRLESLLTSLREMPELVERKRGTFYRRSRAFLHFHEDPAGLFADVRLSDDFERLDISSRSQQDELLRRVRSALGGA